VRSRKVVMYFRAGDVAVFMRMLLSGITRVDLCVLYHKEMEK